MLGTHRMLTWWCTVVILQLTVSDTIELLVVDLTPGRRLLVVACLLLIFVCVGVSVNYYWARVPAIAHAGWLPALFMLQLTVDHANRYALGNESLQDRVAADWVTLAVTVLFTLVVAATCSKIHNGWKRRHVHHHPYVFGVPMECAVTNSHSTLSI